MLSVVGGGLQEINEGQMARGERQKVKSIRYKVQDIGCKAEKIKAG